MCALFGGRRDVSFFRHINKEIINNIISTEVGIYKLVPDDSEANIYGETDGQVYYRPVKCPCLISRDEQSWEGNEFGQDYNVSITFAFLRDSLKDINLLPEVGDILLYDNEYYELDQLIENQYFVGKNQDTQLIEDDSHGWDVSLVYAGHVTRRSKLNLVDVRGGINQERDLPDEI